MTRARGRNTKLPSPVKRDGQVRSLTTWSGVIPSDINVCGSASSCVPTSRKLDLLTRDIEAEKDRS